MYKDVHILVCKDAVNSSFNVKKQRVPGVLGCNVIDLIEHAMPYHKVKCSSFLQETVKAHGEMNALIEETKMMCKNRNVLSFIKSAGTNICVPAGSSCVMRGTGRHLPAAMDVLVDGHVLFEVSNVGSKDI